MKSYEIEFEGITCKGCITAIEHKLSSLENTCIKKMDRNTGTSIIDSSLGEEELSKKVASFQGCCESCKIELSKIDRINTEKPEILKPITDTNYLIKKQYKHALEGIIAKREVACSEYCVCKTTDVNRFDEFPDAPSFSSIVNLEKYLQEFGYLTNGLSIIDFGCGTCHDAFQIAPLIEPGLITGIDFTQEMVDFADQTALKRHVENAVFHQSDNLRMIQPSSQDVLIANNVFNILSNQDEFLLETYAILKTGGLLIIADEFNIDMLPDSLRNDPAFQCGGIAGAETIDDLIHRIQVKGFDFFNQKLIGSYCIEFNLENYKLQSIILVFKKTSVKT